MFLENGLAPNYDLLKKVLSQGEKFEFLTYLVDKDHSGVFKPVLNE
jgi:hypothetical protein